MHAGLKVIPTDAGEKVIMIIGLSGTGKTTTTFTTQNGSEPVQDDFVGLMPGGHAYGTENGCFAKTFSLDPDFEPSIYGAVVKPTTYLENAYQDDAGNVNFFEESYTQNGRAVFEMSDLQHYRDAREVGTVDYLLILNRNENIIPAVAKLSQEQAAAYFMLGETTGTSAGGAAEAGIFLRVPGTNPFFPLPHGLQGNRILELLASHPIETYLLNTGRVGGKADDDRSKKLKIPHTSACVKGIAEGSISFTEDEDFGYLVAEAVPGIDEIELLQPRRLYERQGRAEEYIADRRPAEDRAGRPAPGVPRAVRRHRQSRRLVHRRLGRDVSAAEVPHRQDQERRGIGGADREPGAHAAPVDREPEQACEPRAIRGSARTDAAREGSGSGRSPGSRSRRSPWRRSPQDRSR